MRIFVTIWYLFEFFYSIYVSKLLEIKINTDFLLQLLFSLGCFRKKKVILLYFMNTCHFSLLCTLTNIQSSLTLFRCSFGRRNLRIYNTYMILSIFPPADVAKLPPSHTYQAKCRMLSFVLVNSIWNCAYLFSLGMN